MADKKISQLTGATTPATGAEELPIVQTGATTKISIDNLTKGRTVNALSFDTDIAAAGVTLSGTTLSADGTNTNIDINITPKGTGEVNIPKVDIDGGTIDGTTIGGSSAAAATVTSLTSAADNAISISGFYVRTKSLTVTGQAAATSVFTVAFGNFTGRAIRVAALGRLFSGAGGSRVFYRQSLIVETGGGALAETNLVDSQGSNGTLAFSLSGSTLTVTIFSNASAGTSETCEMCLEILSRTPGTITVL
jgi:hypothetical protein